MRYLIFILLIKCSSQVIAQNSAALELQKFQSFYDPYDYEYPTFPWQSFRLVPYLSFQIDMIANDEELKVLQEEPYLFSEALLDIYNGYPLGFERIELIKRWSNKPRKYQVHIPGLVGSYQKQFRTIYPADALDFEKNGMWGYYFKVINNTAIGMKKLDSGEWLVSAVMFLKGVNPNFLTDAIKKP